MGLPGCCLWQLWTPFLADAVACLLGQGQGRAQQQPPSSRSQLHQPGTRTVPSCPQVPPPVCDRFIISVSDV